MVGHQFYKGKKLPNKNEVVWINVKDLSSDLSYLSVELLEYPCEGIIQTKNLSRRMRSRKGRWRSYIPKKPVPAIVEDVDERTNSVVVSRRHILEEDVDYYNLYFSNNNRLTKIIKRMAIDLEEDFNSLWEKIVYPLQSLLEDEIEELDIFSVIQNKYKSQLQKELESNNFGLENSHIFDIFPSEYKEYLDKKFKKVFTLKKKSVYTNFLMVAKPPGNIITLKDMYKEIQNKFENIKIILENSSLYSIELESFNQEESLKMLEKVIEHIKSLVEDKNIHFQIKTQPKYK